MRATNASWQQAVSAKRMRYLRAQSIIKQNKVVLRDHSLWYETGLSAARRVFSAYAT
jgi:hypothetical protein